MFRGKICAIVGFHGKLEKSKNIMISRFHGDNMGTKFILFILVLSE